MSGTNRESATGGWPENTKESRRGRFNPTREEIEKATEEYEINGGRIKKTTPDWGDYDIDLISSLDTSCGDDFLMGV